MHETTLLSANFVLAKNTPKNFFLYMMFKKTRAKSHVFSYIASVYNNHLRWWFKFFFTRFTFEKEYQSKINFSRQKPSLKNNYPPLIKQFSSDKR